MFTPNMIPSKRAERRKLLRNDWRKVLPPLTDKIKNKIYLFSVNTKNNSSHVLKISAILLVLRTREITDIFNALDEIYLVFTPKK